jgi:uncharacterized membrane protein
MPVSTKTRTGRSLLIKYAFAFCALIAGIALNALGVGSSSFTFGSVGNWLMYIGAVTAIIATVSLFRDKEKIVDERAEKIGYKAYRMASVAFLLLAFALMVPTASRPSGCPTTSL